MLSQHASSVYAGALFSDGAAGRGYILKDRVADGAELVRILREVAAGGHPPRPGGVRRRVRGLGARGERPHERLTPRENEVLALVATGDTNAVIAEKLGISKRAVERHLNSIFDKLELRDAEHVSRRVMATLEYLRSR